MAVILAHDWLIVTRGLGPQDVAGLVAAFELGSDGRLSDGPVASGRLGSIWRLDTDGGSWAVKQVGPTDEAELTGLVEGAAFQEAAALAGIGTPSVRRTATGDLLAELGEVRARVHGWVEMEPPNILADAAGVGRLVAGLHCVGFEGSIGVDPWYTDPVGAARWREITAALRAAHAPFVDELDALVPELVALEQLLGGPFDAVRTCHRDLWADNVRRTADGALCVFDFDNAGLADPSQELAAVLVEYAGPDAPRAAAIVGAYEEAGGPGRVAGPRDFAMPIAQLAHIAAEGCRRWLLSATDDERVDNEGWVREYLERPVTRELIEWILAAIRA